jgi:hypothetical protein
MARGAAPAGIVRLVLSRVLVARWGGRHGIDPAMVLRHE